MIKTAKVTQIFEEAFSNDKPQGVIRAYRMIQSHGFNGEMIFNRVRIGQMYGVNIDTAVDMAKAIKNNNPDSQVNSRFTCDL